MKEVINFERSNIPQPYEPLNVAESTFVMNGVDNLYPNYLLKLFANCGTHSSIIQNKVNYIIGDGLKVGTDSELNINVNAADHIKEFTNKLVLDYSIFNAFAVEVIYNTFKEPIEYHHIPFHKIRTNKSKTKFWFCEDWSRSSKKIMYDRWVPVSTDSKSKIFYFDGYFPSTSNVYTHPEYFPAITSMESDIALKQFNLNNIKNSFSVSSVITFFNGSNVSEEVKKKIITDLKSSYTGENGKRIIVDFQNTNGKSADVKNLSAGDWDKAYNEVSSKVVDDIMFAHQVTSPILFGIKTPGQLGGTTELEVAYQIFKSTYVSVKRDAIESALNSLFTGFKKINDKVYFKDKSLFELEMSEALEEKILTINELREKAGRGPLKNGDRLLAEIGVEELPAGILPESVDVVASKKNDSELTHKNLTEDDFELIKEFGLDGAEFDIVDDGTITKLQFAEGDVLPSASVLPVTDRTFIMYQYRLRPDVTGPALLPTSRGFCVKLINNNRLYTRADIQSISTIFGYDIFDYSGGFYHNSDTGETTSHCRHYFFPIKVKRRIANP